MKYLGMTFDEKLNFHNFVICFISKTNGFNFIRSMPDLTILRGAIKIYF